MLGMRRIRRMVRHLGRKQTSHLVFPPCVRIRSPQETISAVEEQIRAKQPGAYLRFGDGEVNLLHGGSAWCQASDPRLAAEMKEAFALAGPGVVKSLMLHSPRFGIWPGMHLGIHGVSDEWAESLLARCYEYFIGEPIYSQVALPYLAAFDPDRALNFLRLLKSEQPIFVGNKDVERPTVERLFGNTIHVMTPPAQAYEEIDRIERETIAAITGSGHDFRVVVVAMGGAGRPLQKRLFAQRLPVFSFDFGSLLDAFCGWNTRAWMDLAPGDMRALLHKL